MILTVNIGRATANMANFFKEFQTTYTRTQADKETDN